MEHQPPPRSKIPEPPYSWESKTARRAIRAFLISADRSSAIPSRLSLYGALCEESSNKGGGPSFVISQKILGDMAGLSARSVIPAIRDLMEIGVLRADDPENGGRGMKTYHLLSLPCEAASERCEATSERSANDDSTRPFRTTEENKEEQIEEREKVASSAAQKKPRTLKLPDEQWLKELEANPVYEGIDIRQLLGRMQVWCREKGLHPTRSRFLNWLNRQGKPIAPAVKPSRFAW